MDQNVKKIRESRWQELISEALSSGMTKSEWCRLHGIRIRKFYYWQGKLRKKALLNEGIDPGAVPKTTCPSEDEEPTFIELTPPEELSAAVKPVLSHPSKPERAPIDELKPELLLAYGGFQVLIGHEIEEDILKKVIRVIKDA